MSNITPFQVIILIIFGIFLLFAVLIFSGILPLFNSNLAGVQGDVTIWGTFPEEPLRRPLEEFNREAGGIFRVLYVEKREESFDTELVEALASDRGPDIILLPQDLILRHQDKVFPIPFESLSVRKFLDTFVEEGELYLTSQGVLALPFSIDPLVMYWNRDVFQTASLSLPPATWDEFFTLSLELTKVDNALNIIESTVALGEFQNVLHAKEILSLIIMQAGNPIVMVRNGSFESVLQETSGLDTSPTESSLRFFTEFSNPAKSVYSWNRSLPNSKDMFLAGDLAVYFGFASEIADIRAKSPHLNFDIALIPQVRDTRPQMTFSNMIGFAVLRDSRNPSTAFHVAGSLSGRDFVQITSEANALPPVRRDLLSKVPPSAFGEVLYQSALISRAWRDPNPAQTNIIFKLMVENTISGRERISEAIARASQSIGGLLPQ